MRIKIVKGLLGIAIVTAVISVCMLDSRSIAPIVAFFTSMSYIGLVVYANQDILE